MNLIKPFISLLLLLTYSIGFAHNLVPHCSSLLPHENHVPSHQDHNHKEPHNEEPHNEDHTHVLHNNHVDEGLLYYVICVVNETGGEENECVEEHCFTVNTNPISLKKTNHLPTAIVLFVISSKPIITVINTNFIVEKSFIYASPPTSNTPLRGPPFFL